MFQPQVTGFLRVRILSSFF